MVMEPKPTNTRAAAGPGLPVRDEVRTPPPDSELSRRTALKLFSATALLTAGGLGGVGCTRKPERTIVSLSDSPEYQDPGTPLYYASTWTEGLVPYGIQVKAVDGRPVKIEGLAAHPLNQGTSTAQMQASLLSLYDPERLRSPTMRGTESVSWQDADAQAVGALKAAKSAVVITRGLLGPSERALVARFLKAAPGAKHFVWESAYDAPRRGAWKQLFGGDGILEPDFAKAKIVLSLDADFLGTDGDVLTATREFAARRKVDGDPEAKGLSRLYVAESAMSVTGSNADHRIPMRPSEMAAFLDHLLKAVAGQRIPSAVAEDKVFQALVGDLRQHRGEAVALAGPHLPEVVHAAVALLNGGLDAYGKTLRWNPEPPTLPASDPARIREALAAGPDVVLLLDVNPVYDWPGGGFDALLGKAKLVVGHGLTANETLAACGLALPSAHNLESWNDAAPMPGVLGLCQPLIAPLFGGRQWAESLLTWTRALAPRDADLKAADDWYSFVKNRWQTSVLAGAANAKRAWEDALRAGFVGAPQSPPAPQGNRAAAMAMTAKVPPGVGDNLDLVLVPHHATFDGRFAGNAWLQELPEPASKLVWDNAAAISPATAAKLGVAEGDWLTLAPDFEAPVLVQPGTAPDTVVLALGQGRSQGAGVGDGVGVNAARLLGARSVQAAKSGRKPYELVRTQRHFTQSDRDIERHLAIAGTAQEYAEHEDFAQHRYHKPENRQLDPEWDYSKGRKWAMAIDLSACTGCNACVIACQAENNIHVVGKDECSLGREMHWMRIDRYEAGDQANPEVIQQPMLCQHCDNAPCESVCPVNATAHSPEGLNEQTYNRCVGTRYCANNCPYKVRRFNFYNYTKENVAGPERELAYNPQVTVRMRGVMEKCTFCIQRINAAKFAASNRDEEVQDGAVVTACQQACPAGAIVFGDLNDPKSEIARKNASPLGYDVLEELNVRPNVKYLAKVRNPNEDTVDSKKGGGH
jgi:molybdopterin-containing oxidoreductase family iron-sulfur binding subunit